MGKIDFKKEIPAYKTRKGKFEVVQVPVMNFLMVDGLNGPESLDFQRAIEALFGLAYTLKFMIKKGPEAIDYGVMPLEGLWWSDDMESFETGDKSKWMWTAMIMQPPLINETLVGEAKDALRKRKNPSALDMVRFGSFEEGPCMQTLHVGPFDKEGPVISEMHGEINKIGHLTGKHHEIYLSDFRRAAPEKLRTILRQPLIVNN